MQTGQPDPNTAQRKRNLVRINNRVVPRTLAEGNGSAWQMMLEQDYLKDRAPTCLCRGNSNPLEMYIAKQGSKYALKRKPNTGQLHHPECESYGGISQTAADLYTKEAISETRTGKINIQLSVPLTTMGGYNPQDDESAQPPRHATGVKRNTISLRGMLNHLWESSTLNIWLPAKDQGRRLGQVYDRLATELDDVVFGRRSAAVQVYVPDTSWGAEADLEKTMEIEQRFITLQRVCGEKERPVLIVIGEVYAIKQSQYGFGVKLKGVPTPIWIRKESFDRLARQWPHAVGRFQKEPSAKEHAAQVGTENRLFIIAGVQRSESGSLQWRYGAAMETTRDFIPVESEYEARVARMLVDQGRRFAKPLVYDAEEGMFPDFELLDAGPTYKMEVFGMSTPEYLRRKAEKLDAYKKGGQAWWYWDATISDEIPKLPPKTATP